jgi:hypothetical protein
MKHLFSLLTLIVMSLSAIAGDKVTLHDVMYGGYWPQTYAAIKPMGKLMRKIQCQDAHSTK